MNTQEYYWYLFIEGQDAKKEGHKDKSEGKLEEGQMRSGEMPKIKGNPRDAKKKKGSRGHGKKRKREWCFKKSKGVERDRKKGTLGD